MNRVLWMTGLTIDIMSLGPFEIAGPWVRQMSIHGGGETPSSITLVQT